MKQTNIVRLRKSRSAVVQQRLACRSPSDPLTRSSVLMEVITLSASSRLPDPYLSSRQADTDICLTSFSPWWRSFTTSMDLMRLSMRSAMHTAKNTPGGRLDKRETLGAWKRRERRKKGHWWNSMLCSSSCLWGASWWRWMEVHPWCWPWRQCSPAECWSWSQSVSCCSEAGRNLWHPPTWGRCSGSGAPLRTAGGAGGSAPEGGKSAIEKNEATADLLV